MHVEMVAAFAAMIFSKPTFIAGGSGMEEVRCVNNVSALYSSYSSTVLCKQVDSRVSKSKQKKIKNIY